MEAVRVHCIQHSFSFTTYLITLTNGAKRLHVDVGYNILCSHVNSREKCTLVALGYPSQKLEYLFLNNRNKKLLKRVIIRILSVSLHNYQ